MHTVLLLINPLLVKHARRQRELLLVQQILATAGVQVTVKETPRDRAAGALVRSIGGNFDAVLVCGGDGTVFDAVQGAVGTPVPIGIVPMGTGNIMAHNLRIPIDPGRAVKTLLGSHRRSLPLGRITCGFAGAPLHDWYFLFAAGMGMHASLLGSANAWGKHTIGPAAYYVAGIDLLLRGEIAPFEMETTDGDGRVKLSQYCEAIGVRVGALNRWRPGGAFDSGSIRIVAVPGASRAALAGASILAIVYRTTTSGAGRRGAAISGDFVRAHFRPVPGYRYRSAIKVEADGEVLGDSSATIEMTGETVTLLVPEPPSPEPPS